MPSNPPSERRKRNIPAATDRRKNGASAPKPAPPPTPPPVDDEATRFMKAMERYKRENRRPFPTWSEVLEVLRALGYRKVGEAVDAPAASEGSPTGDPRTTPATIDRRQKDVPVAHDRRQGGSEPPLPPKG